jgi:DNA-binding FadR family transcriptional regulator
MEITESRRLYQQLAAELKDRIEQGVYLVGDKLPAERFIADEKSVSRTVVREAIIMLEVEGYVEVRKGSGIHVISSQPKYSLAPDESLEFASYGPFELLQARQLIESNIAEFAATQVTKQDIMKLMEIQENARKENVSAIQSGISSSTYRWLWLHKTRRWQQLSKKCGLSAFTTRTGRNCTITLIHALSTTGVTTTIRSLKR